MTFASLVALVPVVAITSPAQAAPDYLTIASESDLEGDTITFDLNYTGDEPATYEIATADSWAEAGTDYTALSSETSVVFTGGEESKRVSVRTLPDDLYEGEETFLLTATLGTEIDTATGTIENDDAQPTYQLSVAPLVNEDADGILAKPVRVTATLSAVSGITASIPSRTIAGTATSSYPQDFLDMSPSILTVTEGDLTGFIDIFIIDDNRHEDEIQSFTVGPYGDGLPPRETSPLTPEAGVVTINIEDDDPAPTVDIGGAGSAVEGSPLTFPITLSARSEKVVTVAVSTADGTDTQNTDGAVAGTDYTALSGTVTTFVADDTAEVATVSTIADNVFQTRPETLSATISNPQNATLGQTATALGSITEDPSPTVELSPLQATEGDTAEAVTDVIATLSRSTDVPVEITYTVAAGTGTDKATDGDDFMSDTDTVTIPIGQTTATIPVEIIGDTMDEPDETVAITISTPNMSINSSSVGTKVFTITDDDDKPTYTVGDVSEDEDNETDVVSIPVTLSNESADDLDFVISTDDGTAVTAGTGPGSEDYDAAAGTLTIPSGQLTRYINVTVNGDDVFERAEDATFGALPATGETMVNPNVAEGGQHAATLTLRNDDDVPTLEFNETTGTEGTLMRVAAAVIGSSQYPISLDLAYLSYGEVAAAESDYDATENATTATIEPGATAIPLGYMFLEQDTIDEAAESLVVVASEVGTVCARTARCARSGTARDGTSDTGVTVTVDAPIRVGFETVEGEYTISDDPGDLPPTGSIDDESIVENEGSVDLTVDLAFRGTTTSSEQAFTVPWWTEDGSATAGLDFVDEPEGLLTIPAGEMSGTINVEIINDTLYERNEAFAVRLGDPGPAGATVAGSVAEVEIVSDDDPAVPTMLTPASIKGPGPVAVTGVTSPGVTVVLMLGTFGTTTDLVRVGSVVADGNGRYSFSRRISTATRFGVRVEDLNSIPRTVRIVQYPSLSLTSGAKGVVTLSVLSNPKMSGQLVYLQRLNAGKWVTVTTGRTGSTGYFVKRQSGFRSGTSWSFRAYVVGSTAQGTMSGYSTAKRITVR